MKNFNLPKETDSSYSLKPLKSGSSETLLDSDPFSQRMELKPYSSSVLIALHILEF